ncbi:hypothetical protein [Zavarzinella formosa]|uniref:hypothetical protein n=1 Tax=Zavarzinella formosa TaxID=360055 RepID=UPI0002D2D989|nr:hypothetical protein [Zavarzinella formosa]
MNFLSGYKTYIAAGGLALMGVVDLINGDLVGAGAKFAQALGLAGIRGAIAAPDVPVATPAPPLS